MKPLERIFFEACLHEQLIAYDLSQREFSVRVIGNIFSRLGFPYKQLMYYVEKWSFKGFYEYGTTLDLGWFYIDKLFGEYKKIYEEMKERTYEHWNEREFSKYILEKSIKGKVTNYAIWNFYGIGEDEKFFGEK